MNALGSIPPDAHNRHTRRPKGPMKAGPRDGYLPPYSSKNAFNPLYLLPKADV